MKVPFVDLKANYYSIKEEIDAAISNILDNTSFIKGKPLVDFEEKWAKACNADFCIGTSSGTTSLELILKAYEIGRGDEVICPSHTFIATAEAIVHAGAKPVFVEIGGATGLIAPKSVQSRITDKTKAVIIVDIYGQPADYDGIKKVIAGRDIKIIQDSAQSHFGRYKGKKVGSYADATSFSFYPGKNLGAFGDAGAVLTNDSALALKIRMLSDHGRISKYEHELVGHNYRMDALQAAILSVKIDYLQQWVDRRKEIAALYRQLLPTSVTPLEEKEENEAVYHLFVIKAERREQLMAFLAEKGIATGIHYPLPLHLQPAFNYLGYAVGDFSITENLANEIISLPIYPEMDEEMVVYISKLIKEFYL